VTSAVMHETAGAARAGTGNQQLTGSLQLLGCVTRRVWHSAREAQSAVIAVICQTGVISHELFSCRSLSEVGTELPACPRCGLGSV
jgi:hypothetical protein